MAYLAGGFRRGPRRRGSRRGFRGGLRHPDPPAHDACHAPLRRRAPCSSLCWGRLGFSPAHGHRRGIFLSPILFLLGWATVGKPRRRYAFIVLNSIAGLAAKLPANRSHGNALAPLAS
jgi:hypothetical protein